MNKLSITCLALASSLAPVYAQAPAAALPATVRVRITSPDVNSGRTTDMYILQGKSKNVVTVSPRPDGSEPVDIAVSKSTAFYMMQPNELKRAIELYQDGKLEEARKYASASKKKYIMVAPLAHNPATTAALLELECAIRLLDFAGVKEIVASFPQRAALEPKEATGVDISELLGLIADQKWADIISKGTPLLAKQKGMPLKQIAQLNYAMGVAKAAQFDAATLSSEDDKVRLAALKQYNSILDNLAVSIVAEHNASPELVGAAILHSLDLYAKSPAVIAYLKEIGAAPVSIKMSEEAPQNLKDAAGLSYIYSNILFPDKKLDPKYQVYTKFYRNPLFKDEKPAPKKEEPTAAEAPAAAPAPAEAKK